MLCVLILVNLVPSGPASSGWGASKNLTQSSSASDLQQYQQQSRQQSASTAASSTTATSGLTSSSSSGTLSAAASAGGSGVGTASHQHAPSASAGQGGPVKSWSGVAGRQSDAEHRPPPAATTGMMLALTDFDSLFRVVYSEKLLASELPFSFPE